MRSVILASASLLALVVSATPSHAQSAQAYRNWDENGVDVVRGDFNFFFQEASIGSGKARLDLVRENPDILQPYQWDNRKLVRSGIGTITTSARKPDDTYFKFTGSTSDLGDGATITTSANFTDITDSDGVRYHYSNPLDTDLGANNLCSSLRPPPCSLPLTSITYPDGTEITLTIGTFWNTTTDIVETRVVTVSNNFGYDLNFRYNGPIFQPLHQSGSTGPSSTWWQRVSTSLRRSGVTQATVSYAYPSAGTVEITDPAGQVWTVTALSIKKPGDATPSFTVTGSPTVTSVTNAGVTTSYNRVVSGSTVTLTKTDPLGKQTVITSDSSIGRVKSIKDPLNRTTSYQYDTLGRLTKVTRPEGDGVDYVLDARGNATQIKQRPKTGSASPLLITTQTFPATCTNPLTCNQPAQVTDPAGNATDYTYDATHGGVLTITRPAPTTGAVRPQTRYSYTAVSGVHLPSGMSECQTLASCTGAADEVKTTIGYDAYANPTSVAKGSGNGSLTATSTMTYDGSGNLLTTDGPLSGTDDTTRYRYDAARRLIGVVSPDPDGAGVLKNRAVRNTYDGAGRLTKVERGTVNSQSDPDWALFATAETLDIGLDANGRPVTQKLSGSSGAAALTQISYDSLGRPECSAVRMNPAIYASLPASACSLGTAGSFGPDRISKTVYDAAGQVIQQQVAVGTTDAATERTLTYTSNGKLQTLKDAENNLTTYEYDEYDRLLKTRFPVATPKGANASSTTDYEQLSYDTRSNVTSRRLRSGNSIAFTYDNLNRITLKDLPGSEPDVTYAYDNLGRMTSASQTGFALSFTYDALSRNLTQVSPQGTTASVYDLAGRRTQLTYPGTGLFVNTDYLVTGETTKIRENGATSGVGVLATYGYDDLGRRTSLTFGNGVVQSFGYDPVSRLASLTNELSGTINDLSATFTYNPASQITSTTRTGDAYAWTQHFNENQTGTPNGLNQLTAVGTKALTHDTKGNVTAFGAKSFTYSSENLLLTGPGSTTLSYDPLMRLRRVVAGGATTNMVYDGLDRIAEYSSSVVQRRYVHGPGMDEPIVWYEGSGTSDRRFLSADERGSIASVTNSSGTLLGINRYDEYGQPQSTNLGVWGYTGQAWLPSLGVWYYKARVYDPELGRFLQPDPLEHENSPNPYQYVSNDPNNRIDPNGMRRWTVGERAMVKSVFNGLVTPVPIYSFGWRSSAYPHEINIRPKFYRQDFRLEWNGLLTGTEAAENFWHEVYHLFEMQLGLVTWRELFENQAVSLGFDQSIYDFDQNKSFMGQDPEARAKYFARCMTRGICSALNQFIVQRSAGEWVIFTGYTFKTVKIPTVYVWPPDPDKDKPKDDPLSGD